MSLSHRYRQLAALIEALESHGITVQEAGPVGDGETDGSPAGRFPVQLCIELPADATLDGLADADRIGTSERPPNEPVGVHTSSPVAARTEDDSTSLEAVEVAEETDTADGSEDPAEADVDHEETSDAVSTPDTVESTADTAPTAHETVGDDTTSDEGAVSCTHPDCDRTFETDRGMKIHRTKAHPLSELADQTTDRTVHHDPEVLARVYDEYETFAEMTEALDVDVGTQAVRKQMIRHGVHEPGGSGSSRDEVDDQAAIDADADANSAGDDTDHEDTASARKDGFSRTGAGPGDPSAATEPDTDVEPAPITDSLPELDLPESLSTEDLQTAVEEATTLFDVQRALDLDQQTAREVLTEYDLLELVSGRAASLRDREELKAEIGQRIRRTAT